MNKHRGEYDWFECPQHLTALIEYPSRPKIDRSYSGSQMGRKAAFEKVLPQIEDDYLYRNEDIIISTLIRNAGQRWGRAKDTFHYHELMNKRSKWLRTFKSVDFEVERSLEEEVREFNTQVRGIIKYLQPEDYLIYGVQVGVDRLRQLGELDWEEFAAWVQQTNPAWLAYVHKDPPLKQRLRTLLKKWAMKVLG
jgi:hypothetical protein